MSTFAAEIRATRPIFSFMPWPTEAITGIVPISAYHPQQARAIARAKCELLRRQYDYEGCDIKVVSVQKV